MTLEYGDHLPGPTRKRPRRRDLPRRVRAAVPSRPALRPARAGLAHPRAGSAILATPSRGTWSGHRDQVLLASAYNTGPRVSELTALRVRDVLLDRQTAVHLHGNGRKQRVIP